ncbi:MAG: glycosyltransferase [Opitutus sp.]|nr:glycosyltransferase [Opitutus sp.]
MLERHSFLLRKNLIFAKGEATTFGLNCPAFRGNFRFLQSKALIKISVAIPTYNRADFLRQTLAGIAAQHFPRDHFEVLVIDNNSTDHTRTVVDEFANTHPAPRHVFETKQGLDHARNRAIAEARGEVIVFGDDDILVQPDWLAQMVVPLLADTGRRIGAVGGEVVPVFPDGLPDWIREWHAPLGFRADTGPLEPKHSPMGANLAFPAWVFDQLGLFHTALDRAAGNYFSGGDSEMIRRVRAAGLEVWFAPAAAVKHQMPANRTTFRYASRHAFDSARSRVIDRAGQPGAAAYLLGRLFANVAKAFGFALLALLYVIIFRTDAAKKALVRAWRSCGYLYQIPRSLLGRV